MFWPWKSLAAAARLASEREARFVRIARQAHERARRDLGPQALKPRDWECTAVGEAAPRRAEPT